MALGSPNGFAPADDGLPPPAYFEAGEKIWAGNQQNFKAAKRASDRVKSIRAELAKREAEEREAVSRLEAARRDSAETVLANAQATARRFADFAIQQQAAAELLIEISDAIRLAGGSLDAAQNYAAFKRSVEDASLQLAKPMPTLPTIEFADKDAVTTAIYDIAGGFQRHNGLPSTTPRT